MDKDKEKFWQNLTMPTLIERGCWNCNHANKRVWGYATTCQFSTREKNMCMAYNILGVSKICVRTATAKHFENIADQRWLAKWEWNGQR